MLEVVIYNATGEKATTLEDVDFVSLVNNETFGPPPLVAPNRGEQPLAKLEERVLYINTSVVPMFEIVRVSDR